MASYPATDQDCSGGWVLDYFKHFRAPHFCAITIWRLRTIQIQPDFCDAHARLNQHAPIERRSGCECARNVRDPARSRGSIIYTAEIRSQLLPESDIRRTSNGGGMIWPARLLQTCFRHWESLTESRGCSTLSRRLHSCRGEEQILLPYCHTKLRNFAIASSKEAGWHGEWTALGKNHLHRNPPPPN